MPWLPQALQEVRVLKMDTDNCFAAIFFRKDQILWETKYATLALAGVAQRIKHHPAIQKVTSWIPSQGTCKGCGPGP